MYSRATRNVVQTVGSTPVHIGPGAYDTATFDANRKKNLDSYAPFLSLSLREDIFSDLKETPGPGHYDLKILQRTVKGGRSMANKSKRFSEKVEDLPGPGAYMIEEKENNRSLSAHEIRLSKQRVKLNRKKNPASIQDPKNAFGYEEAPNGELIAQSGPENDKTIGPAYYNVNNTQEPSPYKGIHFGKYSSKRINFSSRQDGPGPGEYDVVEPVHINVEHYHMKNMIDKKPELKVARYPDNLLKTVEKDNTPGPGKYEQKRLFDDLSQKQADIYGIDIERPPFGIQSKRFDNYKLVTPGPGTYTDQRTALESLKKVHSLKKTPFMQSSARFETMNTYKSRSAPGPGQYRINGFAEDNLRRAIIESRRKPAFGQSSERKFNLSKKEPTPGPAQYKVNETPYKAKKEAKSANFASNTKQRDTLVEDTPGPTAYDVTKAYENLVYTKREPPRTRNALKRQTSFNIVSRRDFNLSTHEEIPGPGSYDLLDRKGVPTVPKMTEKRWKDTANPLPGPADYELSPMYQDTLLKGTFNATLNNPLVNKKQKANSDTNLNNNKLGIESIQKELKI